MFVSHIESVNNNISIFYETDLREIENIIDVTNDINEKYNVSILINNVGLGGTKRFDNANINYINSIIQLNIMATTIMTKQLLPNLQKQERAYILNVSSMAALSPTAFKTVYPASKVYVYFLTRGLHEEYKKSNLFISVVNPGPMKTNSNVTARINKGGFFGKIGLLSPQEVAESSIKQLFKRRALIKLKNNRLSNLVLKTMPIWIKLPLLSRVIKKELK